jgi:hypothetical protein
VELFDGVTSLGSASVNGTNWSLTSPSLSDALHSITAKASDGVLESGSSNTVSITVDTAIPITTIVSAIDGNSNPVLDGGTTSSDYIEFTFTANGTGSSIALSECNLDSFGYTACTSSKEYSELSESSHNLKIRSTDAAGNLESTAEFDWTVDLGSSIILGLDQAAYNLEGTSVITVTDPAADINPGAADELQVGVTSTTDGAGFLKTLIETGQFTKIFTGNVTLSTNATNPGLGILQVAPGDTFTVTYSSLTTTASISAGEDISIDPVTANPKWGVDFGISGSISGPGDNVVIDWGDTTQSLAIISGTSFSASHIYDSANIGSKTISAFYNDGATEVANTSALVDVQKQSTSISLSLPSSIVEESSVTASGQLVSVDTGKGIPSKLISLSDAPANIIGDASTNGVQFTSGVTPMQLVFCSTCTPHPGSVLAGANILHVFNGTMMTFPPGSTEVTFFLEDMGVNSFTLNVTPTGDSPFVVSSEGVAPDILLLQIALNGGGTVEVTSSDPVTGVGISSIKIDDPTADPKNIFNQNFDDYAVSECDTCSSLLLGGGNYFSTGITTAGTSLEESVTATFTEDAEYLGSTITSYYAKESNSLAGIGGSTTFTATPSTGAIYTAIVCGTGNDSDGDSLCNAWEGAGNGVPYSVTFGGVKTNFKYQLPSSNSAAKNVYVEYDFMAGHNLLAAAKTSLASAFSAKGITLTLDDTTDSAAPITHLANINAWFDTDANRNNDFDSLKAQYFGVSSERPTITNAGTYTLVAGANSLQKIVRGASIAITTPAGESTQGKIIIKERINVSTSATLTLVPPALPVVAGVEFGTPSSSTTSSGTSRVVVTTIPFATTAAKSFTLPNIDTKVTTSTGAITLTGGQVQVTTSKLEAKAQAYHYGLGVHAIGANGCNSPTGLAEPLGNDFIVSLGCTPLGESNSSHSGPEGTAEEQAGTILHELGHNFNLSHGGPAKILVASSTSGAVGTVPADKDQNCKPNHISVMNYARQLPQPLGYMAGADWKLDYSSGLLQGSPLSEKALNESIGLKSSTATTSKFVWATLSGSTIVIKTGTSAASGAANIAINWDNDASAAETLAANTDINNFGIIGCAATVTSSSSTLQLEDYDEWSNLQYDFRTTAGAQALDGSHTAAFKIPEPTTEITEDIQDTLVESGILQVPLRPDTIYPSKDSYLRKLLPNINEGENQNLFVTYLGSDRTLVAFDQAQIAEAVAGKTLQSATLNMYINYNFNDWGSGRDIEARPLTVTWEEGNGYNENIIVPVKGTGSGVTWNCAVDTNINNNNRNCSSSWNGGKFGSVASKVKITNGKTGWISFDVTGNVKSFLDGTKPNHGWIIKKTSESSLGLITFTSGETTETRPELVLTFTSPVPAGPEIFSDNFTSGFAKWTETGDGDWKTESSSEKQVPGHSSNLVAHSDDCDSSCTLTIAPPIDLTSYSSATLKFWRYVDDDIDSGEYLKVDLYNGSTWNTVFNWTHGAGDDDDWHQETVNLGSYLGTSNFDVRFVTKQSSSSEDVEIDDVVIEGVP